MSVCRAFAKTWTIIGNQLPVVCHSSTGSGSGVPSATLMKITFLSLVEVELIGTLVVHMLLTASVSQLLVCLSVPLLALSMTLQFSILVCSFLFNFLLLFAVFFLV